MTGEPAPSQGSWQSVPNHATRYEALRAYAVERHAPSSRDGLVVLLREGVAAWMQELFRLPARPAPVLAEHQQQAPVPHDVGEEVIHVLAAMTLTHIQEVHA